MKVDKYRKREITDRKRDIHNKRERERITVWINKDKLNKTLL
jgi:hypothetical protein